MSHRGGTSSSRGTLGRRGRGGRTRGNSREQTRSLCFIDETEDEQGPTPLDLGSGTNRSSGERLQAATPSEGRSRNVGRHLTEIDDTIPSRSASNPIKRFAEDDRSSHHDGDNNNAEIIDRGLIKVIKYPRIQVEELRLRWMDKSSSNHMLLETSRAI